MWLRTQIYNILMVITVLVTFLIIVMAFSTATDADAGLVPLALLSILPMLISCKIYNDIKKLILTQESILLYLNKSHTTSIPDDSGNATLKPDTSSKQDTPPAKLWKDT